MPPVARAAAAAAEPRPRRASRRSSGEEDDDEAEDEEEAESAVAPKEWEDEGSNLRLREKLETLWTAKRQMATQSTMV